MMKKILVSNVLAYVVLGEKKLYLSILDNKKHNVLVKKTVDKAYSELSMYEAAFDLKMDLDKDRTLIKAYIKNSDLPSSDYYEVLNFDRESACEILLEAENDKGLFQKKFEAYIDETSASVSFICEGMTGYQDALDEMTRRVYTEVGKKTKKWIPGHRYDCLSGTYYYLGAYLSRKKEEFNSAFINNLEELTPVHIYTSRLGDAKKVSDVFKNQIYTEGELGVIWTDSLPSCVDSGKALEDDTPKLSLLYSGMVKNALSRSKGELKPVFDVLCYVSHLDPLSYPEDVKEPILGIVKDLIKDEVMRNWNKVRAREDRCIGDKVEKEKNVERIKDNLLSLSIQDGNVLERYYYGELFKILSIDLDKEISDFLDTWSEDDLCADFSSFCKNHEYFLARTPGQKITSTQRSGEKVVKISDLFGTGPLYETILKLVKKAELNYGEGITSYRVVKVGRNNNTVSCIVTLDDILREGEPGEELKQDILLYKFSSIRIYFDKDSKVE